MFVFFDLDDTLYSRKEAFFSAVEKYFGITVKRFEFSEPIKNEFK